MGGCAASVAPESAQRQSLPACCCHSVRVFCPAAGAWMARAGHAACACGQSNCVGTCMLCKPAASASGNQERERDDQPGGVLPDGEITLLTNMPSVLLVYAACTACVRRTPEGYYY